jgi:hypothetical protein
LQGKLEDAIYDPEQVKRALERLPMQLLDTHKRE